MTDAATSTGAAAETPLLEADGLVKHFPSRDGRGVVRAVDGVSLHVMPGETLGIVGESGSGKSTVARLITRLIEPDSGTIRFAGEDLRSLSPSALRARRSDLQMVFQDPFASLDPRMTIGAIIAEPLEIHRIGDRERRQKRVLELLRLVGLEPDAADRYPHEFSGGQRQRIGIARAVALEPRLVILDEPVSALDVSIQAQILNLLASLKVRLGLSYILVSHDLAVIEHVSDRVAVMYLGRIVETAPAEGLFRAPMHPYTEALISASPGHGGANQRQRIVLKGEPPNPESPPPGCPFHPRCAKALDRCRSEVPHPVALGSGSAMHIVACHLHGPNDRDREK